MSLKAIEIVNQTEQQNQTRRAAAEQEAKAFVAEAERNGLALLEQTRAQGNAVGKQLLQEAEGRAEDRRSQIEKDARAECDALNQQATSHIAEAVERIVGKVVNS